MLPLRFKHTLEFAQGDFHKKYVSESPLNADKNLSKLRESVLSRRQPKSEKLYKVSDAQLQSIDTLRSIHETEKNKFAMGQSDLTKRAKVYRKHKYEMTPDMHQALKVHDEKYKAILERHKGEIEAISPSTGTKWSAPKRNYTKFIEHDIATNLYKEHSDYHAGLAQRKADKVGDKAIEDYKTRYRKELLNNKPYMAGLKTRYHKVRQNMAEELGYKFTGIAKKPILVTGKRELIQAGRKFKGTLPKPMKGLKPMTEDQLTDFRNNREAIRSTGIEPSPLVTTPKKKVGLAGKHMVGGLNAPPSPRKISKFREATQGIESRLNSMVETTVQRRGNEAEGFKSNMLERAKQHILKHNPKIKDAELTSRASGSVNHILHGSSKTESGSVPISGVSMMHHSSMIGIDVNEAEKARNHYNKLTSISEQGTEQQKIRSQILKRGSVFRTPRQAPVPKGFPALRKLGKVGAIGAGVLGGAYLAKRYFGRKEETEFAVMQNKPKDPTAWHDAAIGGIEGAGSFYTTEKLLSKLSKNLGPGHFLNKGLSRLAISGIVGGAGTAAAGYGLNRLVRKKVAKRKALNSQPDQQLSAIGKVMQFQSIDTNPRVTRTAVAKDRYSKQIKWNEVNRHESDVAKSTIAGAALGGLLRGKRGAAIVGLAGAATSAGLILNNRSKRDMFGDTSINNRRVERLPYQVGGLAAAGIVGHRLLKGGRKLKLFSSRSKLIQFMTPDERRQRRSARRWEEDRLGTRGEELYVRAGRGQRLIRDLKSKIKGESNIDERGRERVPEWKKPWAKKYIAVGAITALLTHRHIAQSQTLKDIGGAIKSGAKGLERKSASVFPKTTQVVGENVRKVGPFYRQVKEEVGTVMKKMKEPGVVDRITKQKQKAKEAAENLKKSRQAQRNYENLSSKSKLINFAVDVPYWDIRDERGRSARVYAPGNQQRQRRKKKWYEKKGNRDLLGAGIGATLLGGGYEGHKILSGIKEKQNAAKYPLEAWGKQRTVSVAKKAEKPTVDIGKKFLRMLNAKLDAIIDI